MTFRFEAPIKMPRFTTEEFRKLKREYQEKHGNTIFIPGFSDIFKWETAAEPTPHELNLYRKKKISELGEHRYEEIKRLMTKKKEAFMKMLASPTPNIVQNAVSILTTLDDVNDTLGTLAVVGRILAKKVPGMFAKVFTGPAGWALTAAELASVAQQITCMPFKPRVLQHQLNDIVKDHPLSKKAKIRRLRKLARLRITKGEWIEGLQTTENMFGVGISLGPIMALVYDVPTGLYRHIKGEKVRIEGLPVELQYFDRIWSRMVKGAASLWTGLPVDFDPELAKSQAAYNLAVQMARQYFPDFNPLDHVNDINDIRIRVPKPEFPSTLLIIQDELGEVGLKEGWPFSGDEYMEPAHIFNEGLPEIQQNIANWRERNKHSEEARIAAQNQVEAGLMTMGAFEGDDALELQYDPHTSTVLNLMNQGYTYPCNTQPEQITCFQGHLEKHHEFYGEADYRDALMMAQELCCIEFKTTAPETPGKRVRLEDYDKLAISKSPTLKRLALLVHITQAASQPNVIFTLRSSFYNIRRITALRNYFEENTWPMGWPTAHLCMDMRSSLGMMFKVCEIPITKTYCCGIVRLPAFTMDMTPFNLRLPPGTPLDPDLTTKEILDRLYLYAFDISYDLRRHTRRQVAGKIKFISESLMMFLNTEWPNGEPKEELARDMSMSLHIAFKFFDIKIDRVIKLWRYSLPIFYTEMLPPEYR